LDRQRQARQYVTTVQGAVFRERDRAVGSREDLNSAAGRVHEPDQLDAGEEVLLELALHFCRRVAFTQNLDGQVWDQIRDGLDGHRAVGQVLPADEGNVGDAHQVRHQAQRAVRTRQVPQVVLIQENPEKLDQVARQRGFRVAYDLLHED